MTFRKGLLTIGVKGRRSVQQSHDQSSYTTPTPQLPFLQVRDQSTAQSSSSRHDRAPSIDQSTLRQRLIHRFDTISSRKHKQQRRTETIPAQISTVKSDLCCETQQPHQAPNNPTPVTMSELAAPPVPYTRLKEIATGACDATLSGINSYTHASTQSWNTKIINTILGTLVEETTPTSSATPNAQPQYKYVVNSTIIQHAPTASGDDGTHMVAGRRGMHAASGAFWNNEKDGMWSFKYEAAEAKGLDVVVGIVWIWVG